MSTPAILAVTKYVCKHCKVPVLSKNNFHAILGREHKKGCPRRRNLS